MVASGVSTAQPAPKMEFLYLTSNSRFTLPMTNARCLQSDDRGGDDIKLVKIFTEVMRG